MSAPIHECQCQACMQSTGHKDCMHHHQMNVFLVRLDEQQRRWYVALESKRNGRGGDTLLSQMTGMDVETIRRGRQELDEELESRPQGRIRKAGGGQPAVEKKMPRSRPV